MVCKDCDTYEEGMIKQERLVSEALRRERKRKTTAQLPRTIEKPQVAGKPLRKPLPPYSTGSQILNQRD